MMRLGEAVENPAEAEVVNRIFADYLAGATYQAIADSLTQERVPYSDNRSAWDKHLIKRVLENRAYIGEDRYPRIVRDPVFLEAQAAQRSKSRGPTLPSPAADAIRERTVCAACGNAISRVTSSRGRLGERWKCKIPGCGAACRLGDREVTDAVAELLGQIWEYPDPAKTPKELERYAKSLEGYENQIRTELDAPELDEPFVKSLILAYFGELYAACGSSVNLQRQKLLEQSIRKRTMTPVFDLELFRALVRTVEIAGDGSIGLRLFSGEYIEQITGEETEQ